MKNKKTILKLPLTSVIGHSMKTDSDLLVAKSEFKHFLNIARSGRLLKRAAADEIDASYKRHIKDANKAFRDELNTELLRTIQQLDSLDS